MKFLAFLKKQDVILALIIAAFGLIVFFGTADLQPDARIMPNVIATISLILAATLIFSSSKDVFNKISDVLLNKHELTIMLVLLATVILCEIIGFYVTLFLGLCAIDFLIFGFKTLKAKLHVFGIALIVTVVLFAFFDIILSMSMPSGFLF